MERCDFASVMDIILSYISEEHELNHSELLNQLFYSYLSSDEAKNFGLDDSSVSRWINRQAKVSPKITAYFLSKEHQRELENDISSNILPLMSDSAMAEQKLYELVIYDTSVSEQKKEELIKDYPCGSEQMEASFLASVLSFAISRKFVKRDARTKKLLSDGNMSPILADYVMGNAVPRPCRYFCGREKELEKLHEMLTEHGKVFLHGIAGIGKSELAKAYAKQYRKEYTNILYLVYSGNLKQDIIDLDFIDDQTNESTEIRFQKHNRFMRSLKSDTLVIVDNFNTTAMEDSFFPELMNYCCRVLFTTKSRIENYPTLLLEEISEPEMLLQLMSRYYSGADSHRAELEQIIETVHGHTLAVELAARLLEHGILEPDELLQKLRKEKIALNDEDKISITKDGVARKETYYGHIHTLFSLYLLSAEQKSVMRNMAFMPLSGVPKKRLVEWLSLSNSNTVNDLIETGFIVQLPGQSVALHPMIQELVVADEKPSITNCGTLCTNLHNICLQHGIDISYYRLLFSVIENIVLFAEKDDLQFYQRFLEDAYTYMDKYRYKAGMQTLRNEMGRLLEEGSCGEASDRALYHDSLADCEKDTEKAISLQKEALKMLPRIGPKYALLTSNLHANLGGMYMEAGKLSLAKRHMKIGLWKLKFYKPIEMHDSITQNCNYAVLLSNMGKTDKALNILLKQERVVKEKNSDQCSDYAMIQEAMGRVYLTARNFPKATAYFNKALRIYKELWRDEPEWLEEEIRKIANMFQRAGNIFVVWLPP